MIPNLFKNLDRENDLLWVVKEFFNTMNDAFFFRAVNYLADRIGYGHEYAGCEFFHELDEYEDPFEGVRCWYLENEVVVSEEDFKNCLQLACEQHVELNHEKQEETREIIAKLTAI